MMAGGILARAVTALAVAGLLLGGRTEAAAQAADPDPARFDDAIAAFADWDSKNTAPSDAVLFVGSSSIRFWPTADRFPELAVINRGFGGSHISDVNHFFDRTVEPYDAATIVFYAGDNDVAGGKSPEQVFEDYQQFVTRVHGRRADTDIVFVPIKPSLARWEQRPTQQEANALVREFSATSAHLHYVDTASPMLGADGRPRPDLFVQDGLHMTPAGYDIWTDIVGRLLDELRTTGEE